MRAVRAPISTSRLLYTRSAALSCEPDGLTLRRVSASVLRWLPVAWAAFAVAGCPLTVDDEYVLTDRVDSDAASGTGGTTSDGGTGGAGAGGATSGGSAGVASNAGATATDGALDSAETGPVCGETLEPPGGACPPQCSGGCSAGTCFILCDEQQECKGAIVTCPPNFACTLQCKNAQACEQLVLNCPADYACHIECDGDQACREAELFCGQAPCTLSCGPDDACETTELVCGPNTCSATCAGTTPKLKACDVSCACTPCV
jgi:hypothetical protein